MWNKKLNVLAIDPGTKHMGFAVFEGTELVDYGVKTIRQDAILEHIEQIADRWFRTVNPDYLVLEKNVFSQVHYNLRLVMAIRKIQRIAEKRGICHYQYDPRVIRKAICSDGNATKKRVAEILITYFPELIVYRKSDKAWVIRYYQNMFDAVAAGLAFIRGRDSVRKTSRRLIKTN